MSATQYFSIFWHLVFPLQVEEVKKPSKRAPKRNAKASVVQEEVEEEEKVPAKKTKAAAKKGSIKAKEKIEAVEEEKSTKRANKRNPSPTKVEAEKEVAEKAKPVNKKGAAKVKGWLISECSFDILKFLINQGKIWQNYAPQSKKWSNQQNKGTLFDFNTLNSPYNHRYIVW